MTSKPMSGSPAPGNSVEQDSQPLADFYAKLARLEKEVLSGKHPKYTFDSQKPGLPGLSPQNASLPPRPANTVPPLEDGGIYLPQLNGTLPGWSNQPNVGSPHSVQQLVIPGQDEARSKFSGPKINPALLTKSDILAQAEKRLKRQRIEQGLASTVNKWKSSTQKKSNDNGQISGPNNFDGSQALVDALSRVAPVSGYDTYPTNDANSASSSFDENNQYYSSQVNSASSPEQNEGPMLGNHVTDIMQSGQINEQHTSYSKAPRVSGLGPNNSAVQESRAELPSSTDMMVIANDPLLAAGPHPLPPQHQRQQYEEGREESYSPPAPDSIDQNTVSGGGQWGQVDHSFSNTRRRQSNQHGGNMRSRDSESYSPPPVPFQSNTSAPFPTGQSNMQPFPQVSSVDQVVSNDRGKKKGKKTKEQRLEEKRKKAEKQMEMRARRESRQQQKRDGTNQRRNEYTRKRKRAGEAEENGFNVGVQGGQFSQSPEPYIKPEPPSPSMGQVNTQNRNNQDSSRKVVFDKHGGVDIVTLPPEAPPPRPTHGPLPSYAPYPSREFDNAPRGYRDDPVIIDDSDSSSLTRQIPRARGGHDLRRVASMQNAYRARTPEYRPAAFQEAEYVSSPQSRFIDRPLPAQQSFYAEDIPQRGPQRMRSGEQPGTAIYIDDDPPSERTSARSAMPPPPKRRIVVDQYGNEYMEIPKQQNTRQSITREVPDQFMYGGYDGEYVYNEPYRPEPRVMQPRQASRPPQPRVIEIDDDEYFPATPSRRLVSQQRPEAFEDYDTAISYRQPHPISRAVSLQPRPDPRPVSQYQYAPTQSSDPRALGASSLQFQDRPLARPITSSQYDQFAVGRRYHDGLSRTWGKL